MESRIMTKDPARSSLVDAGDAATRCDMEAPRENAAEEVTRLRDCMDDLDSTLALQGVWTSGEPPQIVRSLLEAVLGRTSELIADHERLKKEVAELRSTEEALRANELNFQLTVDSMPGMVHTMTATGGVEFVNHQVQDFFGKTVEELNSWDTLLHPDDRSRVVDLWAHSVATGEPFDVEVRALRADGTYRWLHSRALPLRDTNGNIVRWHNLLTDIDDRKRAEAELRRAYDHLAEAQRLSQTGSFTSDLERDEHFWSDEFYRICDFELGSPVTIQRLGSIVHPEDVALYDGAIGRAMAGTDPDFYFRIVTSGGVVKHLRGFAHRIADRPVFVGAVQDVTASKMAQEALNKAGAELADVSRMTTLSALTASIRHEGDQA